MNEFLGKLAVWLSLMTIFTVTTTAILSFAVLDFYTPLHDGIGRFIYGLVALFVTVRTIMMED